MNDALYPPADVNRLHATWGPLHAVLVSALAGSVKDTVKEPIRDPLGCCTDTRKPLKVVATLRSSLCSITVKRYILIIKLKNLKGFWQSFSLFFLTP